MGGKQHKRGGRATPKGTGARGLVGGFSNDERLGLEAIFARVVTGARRDLPAGADPLTAELWASHAWGIWYGRHLVGEDVEAVFGGGLIDHAAHRRLPEALRVLRALAAVAPPPYGERAAIAADRLVGVPEPAWAVRVGTARPMEAWLWCDPVDDDGVSVMVGFEGPCGVHTLGLYVDHNLGGMAKDAFFAPVPPAEVLRRARRGPADGLKYREVGLGEAAARWSDALEVTDMTLDAPVTEDLRMLRALALARLRTLPEGVVPAYPEVDEDERESILAEFLRCPEVAAITTPSTAAVDDVENLAHQVLTFALDYVEGTPLRFSPVMVEVFCCDWAPRKVAVGDEGFALLPNVLKAWIGYTGRRRGIPVEAVQAAAEAVDQYADEMLSLARDADSWGPAKTMVQAMLAGGVDLSDPEAVQSFVDEVNAKGLDVLV